jgi:hypothetical protein
MKRGRGLSQGQLARRAGAWPVGPALRARVAEVITQLRKDA